MTQRLKQWLHTVEGIQRYKRYQTDFSGTILKTMSKNLSEIRPMSEEEKR